MAEEKDPFAEFGGKAISSTQSDPFAEFGGKALKKKSRFTTWWIRFTAWLSDFPAY
jgi:hypothetical protein